MEFSQLEYFIMVAKNESVTKASEILHVSQPAVSKSIRALEKDLGVKLFDRTGKQMVLTAKGKKVAEDAKRILVHYRSIYETCKGTSNAASKHILTLWASAGYDYLPELITGFYKVCPDIGVSIQHGVPKKDSAGISISSSTQEYHAEYLHSVFHETLGVAMSPNHPLASRTSVSIEELSHIPIISLQTGNDMRTLEDFYAEATGVRLQRVLECNTTDLVYSSIQNGLGVAIIPMETWNNFHHASMKALPIRNCKCERYINIQILRPDEAPDQALLFFDFVKEHFSETIPIEL